ncbi:MAG: ABC transporter permease [Dehalococcoidales bacterium]|nr:ABC transporter permease [Dehalococcoidales bacterium]
MILNIIRKEIRELVNKTTVISILMVALIFMFIGQVMGDVQEKAATMPVIAVADLDSTPESKTMVDSLGKYAQLIYSGTDIEEARTQLKEKEGAAVVVIGSGFAESLAGNDQGQVEVEWFIEGAGMTEAIPASVVEQIINLAQRDVSVMMITENSDLDPDLVLAPVSINNITYFKDKVMTGLSPNDISNVVTSQSMAVPIAIMMLVILAGSSLISSMGMEKENKTLETLLTMPIKKSYIIIGKIVASAIVSLIMAVVYMVGFSYYLGGMTGGAINPADYGFTLGAIDYILIGASVFLALLAALAISIVLGAFTTNYRSAQTMTLPLTGVAMFAMFMNMFQDFGTMAFPLQVILFLIPFSHPMMAMKELMFDNYTLVIAGIGYTSLFTVATIAVAAWVFNTDRLITGKISRVKSREKVAS